MQNQGKPAVGSVITTHDGSLIPVSFDKRLNARPIVRLHFLWVGHSGRWWVLPTGMHDERWLTCVVTDEKAQKNALSITRVSARTVMGRWAEREMESLLLPGHVIVKDDEGFWQSSTGGAATRFIVRICWSGNRSFWTLSEDRHLGIVGFIETKADPWDAILVTFVNEREGGSLTFKGVTIKWPRRKALYAALDRCRTT